MATLIMSKGFTVDSALRETTLKTINHLKSNPDSEQLGIVTPAVASDPRARICPISEDLSMVYFDIKAEHTRQLLLAGTYPRDTAEDKVTRLKMEVNPINGITSLVEDATAATCGETPLSQDSLLHQLAEKDPNSTGGITPDELEDLLANELGFSRETIDLLKSLTTTDEFKAATNALPTWEVDACLGLLSGLSIKKVKKEYSLDKGIKSSQDSIDEQVVAGLEHPAAQMQFAHNPDDEELKAILESADFNAWRTFVHPQQRRIITKNYKGSAKISGGAGTGKTVVLLHRAKYLSDSSTGARILMTTYTKSLAESLKLGMTILDPHFAEASEPGEPGIWIGGIDSLVSKVIKEADQQEIQTAIKKVTGLDESVRPRALDGKKQEMLWEDALMLSADDLPEGVRTPSFLSQEYEAVILGNGITTMPQYLRVSRQGRGVALNRAQRKSVWNIMSSFIRKCMSAGRFPFTLLAALAAVIIEEREQPLFDHALIDEAQDFHAGHWRFLRAVTQTGPNDIFLAEDSHQRIYGQRLSLLQFGIETRGRASKKLSLNYRTTQENLNYAVKILEGSSAEDWIDSNGEVDSLAGYRSLRSGPKPIVRRANTLTEEIDAVADQIKQWWQENPNAHIGVLVRSGFSASQISTGLEAHNIASRQNLTAANSEDSQFVSVLTMHNAKGLEFTHVILMGVSKDAIPLKYRFKGLSEADAHERMLQERALLYVAASRARDAMMVTMAGAPSDLLPRT